MRYQDIYAKTYYKLKARNKLYSVLRLVIRSLANWDLKLHYRYFSNHTSVNVNSEVVVSLTSYPARIKYIWLTIETLLHQSTKPQKIVLWLSRVQFPNELQDLPKSLLSQRPRGLDIRFVDGDIRSHKKYYYIFQEMPEQLIMFADDDIIYPSDTIEGLLSEYKAMGADNAVVHKYGYIIQYDKDGNRTPYNSWPSYYESSESANLFFGSGGGTLLKPSSLYEDTCNIELALKLAPKADDIWLNAMCRLAGCPIHKIQDGPILSIQNKEDSPLYKQNMRQGQNDLQLSTVSNYYSEKININPFDNREHNE